MQRFAQEQPELYGLLKDRIERLGEESIDKWDTWLNDCEKKPDNTWLRQWKAYLPSFKAVKGGAMALSNLDPHGVARLITSGVFVAIEVGS